MQSHIDRVHASQLKHATCTFGRITGIFYVLTAVTRGCNGCRNKSQHRKLTQENKIIPPFQQGLEPATFRSRVQRSHYSNIPALPSGACRCGVSLKPVLNWANVCSPNIIRTVRRTMIRFLIELSVRRTWFGHFDELYFVLNWLVLRCKLRPELAADAQQTA